MRVEKRSGKGDSGKRTAHSGLTTFEEDVVGHMSKHFGPVQDLALTEILPVTGVTIHVIPVRTAADPAILFTTGMANRPQQVPPGAEEYRYTELFIRLPGDWPLETKDLGRPEWFWPIRWLKEMARFPHENRTWLGGPSTIISNGDPPEPLGAGTKLTCLMLLCETEELNPVRRRDGRVILLYSMVPLYTEERDLEKAQGLPALLESLTAHRVSLPDPQVAPRDAPPIHGDV